MMHGQQNVKLTTDSLASWVINLATKLAFTIRTTAQDGQVLNLQHA